MNDIIDLACRAMAHREPPRRLAMKLATAALSLAESSSVLPQCKRLVKGNIPYLADDGGCIAADWCNLVVGVARASPRQDFDARFWTPVAGAIGRCMENAKTMDVARTVRGLFRISGVQDNVLDVLRMPLLRAVVNLVEQECVSGASVAAHDLGLPLLALALTWVSTLFLFLFLSLLLLLFFFLLLLLFVVLLLLSCYRAFRRLLVREAMKGYQSTQHAYAYVYMYPINRLNAQE